MVSASSEVLSSFHLFLSLSCWKHPIMFFVVHSTDYSTKKETFGRCVSGEKMACQMQACLLENASIFGGIWALIGNPEGQQLHILLPVAQCLQGRMLGVAGCCPKAAPRVQSRTPPWSWGRGGLWARAASPFLLPCAWLPIWSLPPVSPNDATLSPWTQGVAA